MSDFGFIRGFDVWGVEKDSNLCHDFCVEAADEPENFPGLDLDEPWELDTDGFGYNLPPEAVACHMITC